MERYCSQQISRQKRHAEYALRDSVSQVSQGLFNRTWPRQLFMGNEQALITEMVIPSVMICGPNRKNVCSIPKHSLDQKTGAVLIVHFVGRNHDVISHLSSRDLFRQN